MVLRAQSRDRDWDRKGASETLRAFLSPNHPCRHLQTVRSHRVWVWDLLACGEYLLYNQVMIFPSTELRVKAETSRSPEIQQYLSGQQKMRAWSTGIHR